MRAALFCTSCLLVHLVKQVTHKAISSIQQQMAISKTQYRYFHCGYSCGGPLALCSAEDRGSRTCNTLGCCGVADWIFLCGIVLC